MDTQITANTLEEMETHRRRINDIISQLRIALTSELVDVENQKIIAQGGTVYQLKKVLDEFELETFELKVEKA